VKTSTFPDCSIPQAQKSKYRLTRSLFLRGLGIVYLSAFSSLAAQIDGLIGSRGITPAVEFLDRTGQLFPSRVAACWRLPTIFWLDASDGALHAVCWGGLLFSAALVAGYFPGYCVVLLWASYLSVVVAGQVFLGFQWDSLLLETGLLAILIAPWGLRLSRANDLPWPPVLWLVRWLAFRLMFLSGVVKLASHDPTWRDWTALEKHYQTQPLPVWTSWYVHQMPPWFHALSVGFMFYAELIAPFFVFGPRPLRRVGFVSLVLLQLLIAATGNYGFFNVLAVVICVSILDDRDWDCVVGPVRRRWRPARELDTVEATPPMPAKPWSWPRRLAVGVAAGFIMLVTATQTLETVAPEVVIPSELLVLGQWVEPFRSTNTYGLFAVMTTSRPEIIVEGSDEGVNWKPYRFHWKPCELERGPRFTTPHMPRLDWQMWFAALEVERGRIPSWFFRFEQKLLEGSPAVLGLLRENPFPARPPHYVRARWYLYKFTSWGSREWWLREERGVFLPPLTTEYFR
jgi:lipase maturation factor 1